MKQENMGKTSVIMTGIEEALNTEQFSVVYKLPVSVTVLF